MRDSQLLYRAAFGLLLLLCQTSALAAPGDLDPAFVGNGKISIDIGCTLPPSEQPTTRMLRDTQGFLYLVSYCTSPIPVSVGTQRPSQIEVLKLDGNGNRVSSFGANGIATINTTDVDSSTGALIDGSGDIYISGQSFGGSASAWKIDSTSGSLVASFGNGGIVTFPHGQYYARTIIQDSSEDLYVIGEDVNVTNTFLVFKIDPNGAAVTSFGNAGKATYSPAGHIISNATAAVFDNAGYLYVGGSSTTSADFGSDDFAVAKINPVNGALVTSFGNDGFAVFDLGNNADDEVNTMTFDGMESLYVAGSTSVPIDADTSRLVAAVVKMDTASGALLASFGNNGIKEIDLTGDASVANALALDPGGDLYVAGLQANLANSSLDLAVSKLDDNGNFVAGFGSNGSTIFTITGVDEANSVILDNNGHLYLSGINVNSDDDDQDPRYYLAARLLTADNVSSTTLASSLNPAAVGKIVTFTATVTDSGATPSGTVTFSDGTTVICANVALVSSHASCATSTLAGTIAAHAINASYSGNTGTLGSTSSVLEQQILGDPIFHNGFE
ncbi:MAG: Ig-like domain repeat protein [Leifsonia sp.]